MLDPTPDPFVTPRNPLIIPLDLCLELVDPVFVPGLDTRRTPLFHPTFDSTSGFGLNRFDPVRLFSMLIIHNRLLLSDRLIPVAVCSEL